MEALWEHHGIDSIDIWHSFSTNQLYTTVKSVFKGHSTRELENENVAFTSSWLLYTG